MAWLNECYRRYVHDVQFELHCCVAVRMLAYPKACIRKRHAGAIRSLSGPYERRLGQVLVLRKSKQLRIRYDGQAGLRRSMKTPLLWERSPSTTRQ